MKRSLPALLLVLAALGLALCRVDAGDFRLAISGVQADSDFVHVSFQLSDPLPEADDYGPTSSTPAALAYTLELWRERSNWFDALVSSRTYGFRLEYDHWRSLYRVVTPEGNQMEISNRDDLIDLLCVQENVIGARAADLKPGKEYYFAVTARLTPIDINQLGEVEQWLSGEIRTGTRRGGVLGIPRAVVGMLASLAGFGDRSIVERSDLFKASEPGPGIAHVPER